MRENVLIGVKYCGGCNPYYDRAELAEKLRKQFPDAGLAYYQADGIYKAVIVLHGCSARCTDLKELSRYPGLPLIHVDPAVSWTDLLAQIREVL